MVPLKSSNKEAIDHYNVKYKVGETHCMYPRQHRTRIWNDNRNYVNRALNRVTKITIFIIIFTFALGIRLTIKHN